MEGRPWGVPWKGPVVGVPRRGPMEGGSMEGSHGGFPYRGGPARGMAHFHEGPMKGSHTVERPCGMAHFHE